MSTIRTTITASTTATTIASSTTSSTSQLPTMSGKPVFMHYMIGTIYEAHCKQDMNDAKALGVDAFAINFNQFAQWSNTTVDHLFNNADAADFKLFFSFDMDPGYFSDPAQFTEYLKGYINKNAYFKHQGKPLVSTFSGSGVSNAAWDKFKQDLGVEILLIPGFNTVAPSPSFFNTYSSLDGIFNWNSWPSEGQGKIIVPTTDDQTFLNAAKSANKLYMMGMSPMQFKHVDGGQNWYLRGEQNLEYRMGQVLDLQPDMLEIQTWNDAGESHYMGNIWNEPISDSVIPQYTDGYDHGGYREILNSFIQAWKRGDRTTSNMFPTNGQLAQGVFWHHTLLVNGNCGNPDILGLGKPSGIQNAEDSVAGVVLVAPNQIGLTAVVTSGSTQLGTVTLKPGYNQFSFAGMTTGAVRVEVRDGSNKIVGGSGPIQVTNSAQLCNYNYQVVALSASG
ncbi:hypothetical protein VE02_08364 [Pseudogymnoascus sp. 03VT05]|nr:hypothetical protein VE02_08364 [Pseudogymnoascus sp. 03VT05]